MRGVSADVDAVCVKVSGCIGCSCHTPVCIPQGIMDGKQGWPGQLAIAQCCGQRTQQCAGLLHSALRLFDIDSGSPLSLASHVQVMQGAVGPTHMLAHIAQ